MKKTLFDFIAVGALTLTLGLVARPAIAADPPAECASGRNLRFFDLGVMKGISLVDQAWASLEEPQCDDNRVLDFIDIVQAAIEAGAPAAGSPDMVLCHYAGTFGGALEEANELVNQCADECITNGYMIGEMAATFYCELSIALDGLGMDEWIPVCHLSPCGEMFTGACQEAFDALTQVYPSESDALCLPYTTFYDPPYDSDVYDTARHNQCIYELP